MQDLERDNVSKSLDKTQERFAERLVSSLGAKCLHIKFFFLIQMNFSCCFFPCGGRDRIQDLTHVREVLNLRINDTMFRNTVNMFLDVEEFCFHVFHQP